MEMATLLAREKRIDVNSNLKKQEVCSDWTVVIKKILMNMPKEMIITVLAEFDSVIHCAVVGFKSEDAMESAYHTEPIFSDVKLSWARLDLVHCEKCGHLGHSALKCDILSSLIAKSSKIVKKVTSEDCHLQLAKLYTKKDVLIFRPAVFGGKSWVQVILLAFPSGGPYFNFGSRSDSLPSGSSGVKRSMLVVQNKFSINDHLASFKCSLKLLTDQVLSIMCRLNVVSPATPVSTLVSLNTDMVLDVPQLSPSLFFSVLEDKMVDLGLSSSKVLTSKVGSLESKMMALKVSIGSILGKLDLLCINLVTMYNIRGMTNLTKQKDIVCWHKDSGNMILIIMNKFDGLQVFTSGLDVGFHGVGITIIMNNFLAWHVLKNKLLVTILGLYAGASISTQFSQAANINSMVSKTVNSSSFVVLGGNFNENGSSKSVSFKFCLDLGLVNTFNEHLLAKAPIWSNSRSVEKVIDFILVWLVINVVKASKVNSMVLNNVSSMKLIKHLLVIKKEYHKSKYYESKIVEDTAIRKTIDYCMENFCSDKKKMIKSILKCLFHKVVLDHLVMDNELVIEPNKVKLKIDKIMEEWTRKQSVFPKIPDLWAQQYMPLDYVDDNTFSGVIVDIDMEELFLVVDNLLNDKAARLSRISNELWKHYGREVLACLLNLLNLCLSMDAVPNLPIALVKTACKILSKILSDQIFLACSKFNVLCGNNFLVLKGTLTQSPIFAIGLVVENALEKNKEFWLVLQNMCKAYDSVGWHHLQASLHCIKMCGHFIQFFGNIHRDQVNKVMINFGLLDGYKRIFYDLLLCEIKRHKQLCEYRIDSKFIAKSDRIEASGEKTFFLVADAFVNNMIWIKSSQTSTQYILNIASEFFVINNISINDDKMVNASLLINGLPISIAKKGELHQYLGIFLSTEDFSKPSLAQAHKNIRFFSNIPIVSYRAQFSFVTLDVCHKWDIIIRKGLRAKASLPCDFLSEVLYYLFLYDLKLFEQVQFERKLALLISFSNGHGILGHLFNHRFLDLQVLRWSSLNLLQFPVRLYVSPVNNFLAGVSLYYKSVFSLKHFGVAFGPVPYWFSLMFNFMNNYISLGFRTATATKKNVLSVLNSNRFSEVHDSLLEVWSDCIEIYTDRSLKCAGSVEAADRAAAYFLAANTDIGVKIAGLLFSTLAELQAVMLALECVLSSCSNISIKWVKVKRHLDVLGNIKTDVLANETTFLSLSLPVNIRKRFLVAEKTAISDNVCHFAWDLYRLICCAHWEAGLGFNIVPNIMIKKIDWDATATIWHPDSHMLSGFTSRKLYSRSYPDVLCLLCDEIEFSNHVFTCSGNSGLHGDILVEATEKWMSMSSLSSLFLFAILLSFSSCSLNMSLYTAVYKDFVMRDWYAEAVSVFEGKKKAIQTLTVRTKHKAEIEKIGLFHILGVIESFAVKFGRCKLCHFFSGLSDDAFVIIDV
ncbi:hypothetical protein G9A89_009820 [Geosiphon pyriformis]|nr:hypothetical protein G9A89_009820 [Geosiphon pyriformis]